jgi:methanogenic corrinoid protein MtbC1
MEHIVKELKDYIENDDKEKAVIYVLDKLQSNEIDVLTLYSRILTPLLNNMSYKLEEKEIWIWKEHVRTAIVRTIVECCYPYVIKMRDKFKYINEGVAVVLCPPEEYHDLGARMVADFFTIAGYQAIYVGSNTPYQDFYSAINVIKPSVIAISVSNYYNLIATNRMIEELRIIMKHPCKIVVGGYAFQDQEDKYKVVGADYYAVSFEDIMDLPDREVTS